MLCAWPQLSRISLLSPKRVEAGAGRTDIPIALFSPAAHLCPGLTQPPLMLIFWLQLGVMRIYPWGKEFATSAPMCSYVTDSASGDGQHGARAAAAPWPGSLWTQPALSGGGE